MSKPTDLEGRFDKAIKKGEKKDLYGYSPKGQAKMIEERRSKQKRSTSDGYMPPARQKFEKAKEAHKSGGPYKSALAATESPTFSKMHNARKEMGKGKK